MGPRLSRPRSLDTLWVEQSSVLVRSAESVANVHPNFVVHALRSEQHMRELPKRTETRLRGSIGWLLALQVTDNSWWFRVGVSPKLRSEIAAKGEQRCAEGNYIVEVVWTLEVDVQ